GFLGLRASGRFGGGELDPRARDQPQAPGKLDAEVRADHAEENRQAAPEGPDQVERDDPAEQRQGEKLQQPDEEDLHRLTASRNCWTAWVRLACMISPTASTISGGSRMNRTRRMGMRPSRPRGRACDLSPEL